MIRDNVNMADTCDASVVRGAGQTESIGLSGYYEVKCHGQMAFLSGKRLFTM